MKKQKKQPKEGKTPTPHPSASTDAHPVTYRIDKAARTAANKARRKARAERLGCADEAITTPHATYDSQLRG